MADPTSFEFQIQDDQGLTNRTQVFAAYDGATETVDALIGSWSALGGLLDACIDGKIVGGQILIPLQPNGAWKTAAANGNNVNQVMNLNFGNDFNSYRTSILLPSYKEALLDALHRIDLADPALAAFIAAIIDDTGTVFYNSRDLHQINALLDAFLTVRKVTNAKQRTLVTP